MQRITHKQDGSEFNPEEDYALQLVEDGAEEIVRPGVWEPGLVIVRTTPFAFPAQEMLRVEQGDYEEAAKPTGVAARWFRYPGPAFEAVLEHQTFPISDFGLSPMEDELPADAVILPAETPVPEEGSLLDLIDKNAPVDESRTEP